MIFKIYSLLTFIRKAPVICIGKLSKVNLRKFLKPANEPQEVLVIFLHPLALKSYNRNK